MGGLIYVLLALCGLVAFVSVSMMARARATRTRKRILKSVS